MKFVPDHHRVTVRLPKAPSLDGLNRLMLRHPGLKAFWFMPDDSRITPACMVLSGLRCLPYCPPGWTPRTIDLGGDQQWPETYSGRRAQEENR